MRSLLKIAKTGYLVLSALLILAGVGLAFFSDTFYPILAVLLGILFLVFGAVKLAGFFSKDPYQLVFESDLVFGILYLALGLLLAVLYFCITRLYHKIFRRPHALTGRTPLPFGPFLSIGFAALYCFGG